MLGEARGHAEGDVAAGAHFKGDPSAADQGDELGVFEAAHTVADAVGGEELDGRAHARRPVLLAGVGQRAQPLGLGPAKAQGQGLDGPLGSLGATDAETDDALVAGAQGQLEGRQGLAGQAADDVEHPRELHSVALPCQSPALAEAGEQRVGIDPALDVGHGREGHLGIADPLGGESLGDVDDGLAEVLGLLEAARQRDVELDELAEVRKAIALAQSGHASLAAGQLDAAARSQAQGELWAEAALEMDVELGLGELADQPVEAGVEGPEARIGRSHRWSFAQLPGGGAVVVGRLSEGPGLHLRRVAGQGVAMSAGDPGQAPLADAEARPAAIPFAWALVPVIALIGLLAATIIGLGGSGHVPLVLAAGVAGLVAWAHGYRFATLHAGALRAINLAMGAILILLVIGMLMGTWLAAGIVPALIAWGLELLAPSWFLPASCLVCSIVALVSGSSWSTAGTVGLALIGVGDAMGIDRAMTAGAVISGAYFGDKLSPMSDTTNLAPAMAGSELFVHIRHMLWTTGPAWLLAMIGFSLLGARLDGTADAESIAAISAVLETEFAPRWIHLSVPVVLAVMIGLRLPALLTLLTGALLGGLLAWAQGVAPVEILTAAMDGFAPATGSAAVDELLTNGGMSSMSGTVLLILCAMCFGGVMESSGQLRVLAGKILGLAKSTGSLIAATVLTGIGVNVLAADQYLAVVVPGRMYAPAYRERGLDPRNLSRALEDGGTITSPLVPWNTCGAFMSTTLGVATAAYLPWCFLNLLNPVIGVILGYTGWTLVKLPEAAGAGLAADREDRRHSRP